MALGTKQPPIVLREYPRYYIEMPFTEVGPGSKKDLGWVKLEVLLPKMTAAITGTMNSPVHYIRD
jgi:hypothetical protein